MLWTILIGFFVGLFARWLKPGEQSLGWIMTSLVGIAGAVVATYIGQLLGWYGYGDHAGFLASVRWSDPRARRLRITAPPQAAARSARGSARELSEGRKGKVLYR